ncbi:MAG: hypothetical protein AB1589_39000 [Cyanobacteriota bacterium]
MQRQSVKQSFRLSEDLKTQVAMEGKAKQMTVGEVIRAAIIMYLATQDVASSQEQLNSQKGN